MSARKYINIKINIKKEDICFTKDENAAPPSPFKYDENDNSSNNIRIELGIAKVFHKVLNLLKTEKDLFQKEDFELLGEMLSKILFGKINFEGDLRNYIMKEVEQNLEITDPDSNKICRIFLEFDHKSGVAMLPWEYVLYKTRSTKEPKSIYLSANLKSRFHLIRRVKENVTPLPETDKLFLIVLINVDGNSDCEPPIDSRIGELSKIKASFKNLQQKFPDSLVIEFLEGTPHNEIGKRVEEIYNKWEEEFQQQPCYAIHYVGHSILENQIGKLVIKDAESGKAQWLEDKKFAALFSEDKLNVNQPVMVCFQACDSAKIGSYGEHLRGVAFEMTNINIPAVIGMQNEIDTPNSNAFFERFYDCILEGQDIAEAITAGRDYLGREFNDLEDVYVNNSFGSPVLFITTEEPVSIVKAKEPELKKTKAALEQEAIYESAADHPGADRLQNKNIRAGERQIDRSTAGDSRAGYNNEKEDRKRSAAKPESSDENQAADTQGLLD